MGDIWDLEKQTQHFLYGYYVIYLVLLIDM